MFPLLFSLSWSGQWDRFKTCWSFNFFSLVAWFFIFFSLSPCPPDSSSFRLSTTIYLFSSMSFTFFSAWLWFHCFGFVWLFTLNAPDCWSSIYFAIWLICVSRFLIEVYVFFSFWWKNTWIDSRFPPILTFCLVPESLVVTLIWVFSVWWFDLLSPLLVIVFSPLEVIIIILRCSLLISK